MPPEKAYAVPGVQSSGGGGGGAVVMGGATVVPGGGIVVPGGGRVVAGGGGVVTGGGRVGWGVPTTSQVSVMKQGKLSSNSEVPTTSGYRQKKNSWLGLAARTI